MEAFANDWRGPHDTTVPVHGDIDLGTVDALDDAFGRAIAHHPAVVRVDLSDVDFADSTALNAFVRWHREGQRCGFHVVFVSPSTPVERLLVLTGLDELLTVER
ncbi:MAG TPA: STAS domain-containing protein [Acidimicrobiia bacterium]|nr:STAS domain-containing protein [Acidimicrobiia bacterium]